MKIKEEKTVQPGNTIDKEELCPFSLEPLEICMTRKIFRAKEMCPFTLENCVRPVAADAAFILKSRNKGLTRKKQNCWEFMQCSRVHGGLIGGNAGVCLAYTDKTFDGIHSGKNSGRTCWVISGTLCNDKIQSSFAFKFKECSSCKFFLQVKKEEGSNFIPPEVLVMQIAE